MKNLKMTAAALVAVMLCMVPTGAAGDDHDHDHGDDHATGGPLFGVVSLVWMLETEDDDHTHYTVIVAETNRETHGGVLVKDSHGHVRDSGIQLHDACILHGFDIHDDLIEAYEDATGEEEPFYPYAYIIAQPNAVGFNDEGAIAAAAWFWAELGVSIGDHHGLHDACEDDLGGEYVHADTILWKEAHGH